MTIGRTRLYRRGSLAEEDFRPMEISERLQADPTAFAWLDVTHPDRDELAMLTDELGLHRLALEDLREKQRTKLDRYATHLLLCAYVVRLHGDGRFTCHQIFAFITSRVFVTVHDADGLDVDSLLGRWDEAAELAGHGVAYLLYGLLDEVVDSHFDGLARLDNNVEGLQDMLFDEARVPRGEIHRRLWQARRDLIELRQVSLPTREVINSVMRPGMKVVDQSLIPYYQDVYDHVLRAFEWTESLRDLLATAVETNVTVQGNRLNSIMKQVTSWAAIIAVPTAVTGFYGQNVPIPGQGERGGLLASVAVTVVVAAILYVVFRRKDWL